MASLSELREWEREAHGYWLDSHIGIGVPTGTIAAFAASSCPSGWTEYTPARGRFLRGVDNGAGNDPAGTRAPGNVQADEFESHTHDTQIPLDNASGGNKYKTSFGATTAANRITTATGGTETRPKNVAVTFCTYAGFESAVATGITTLGGLSDVSVGGATNGQVLTYSGGTWIASAPAGAAAAASSTGAIQFNSANALGGDTANLYWDDANNRLGIGTQTPSGTLTVTGNAVVSGTVQVAGGSNETCTAGKLGTIRFNPTTGAPQICVQR